MTYNLQPEHRPLVGSEFAGTRAQQIPRSIISTLLAGLHFAEINLDYVATYRFYKQAGDNPMGPTLPYGTLMPQPFNVFTPRFPVLDSTAYIDGIENEAKRTASEFNMIIRHIGGLPVKVNLENETQEPLDGSITQLNDYQRGEWIFTFKNQQHLEGVNLHGDTNTLRSWHSATLPLPE